MSHWYSKDAEACHFTTMANGSSRASTLRDARKNGWFPSVTGILDSIDKPALTRWKLNQVTQAAYENPPISGDGQDSYHSLIMDKAFEESIAARDRGTDIHDLMETWWNNQQGDKEAKWDAGEITPIPLTTIGSIAVKACKAVVEFCGTDSLIPEQIVIGDGYGGKVDLHNDEFVIDYKTKDIDDISKKMAYPEMCMQLAAYDRALGVSCPPRRCINVFIDRTEPGKVVIHEWKPEEVVIAWEKFALLVIYWQLSKNYCPGQS